MKMLSGYTKKLNPEFVFRVSFLVIGALLVAGGSSLLGVSYDSHLVWGYSLILPIASLGLVGFIVGSNFIYLALSI